VELGLNWAVAALSQSRKPRGRLLSLGLNKKIWDKPRPSGVSNAIVSYCRLTKRAYPVPCQTSSCHVVYHTNTELLSYISVFKNLPALSRGLVYQKHVQAHHQDFEKCIFRTVQAMILCNCNNTSGLSFP